MVRIAKNSIGRTEIRPLIEQTFNGQITGKSLIISAIHRLIDAAVIEQGEERYVGEQTLRQTLNQMADDPNVKMYRRLSDDTDHLPLNAVTGGRRPYLYANVEPVPVYDFAFAAEIYTRYPRPRKNPELLPRTPPVAANGDVQGSRADIIIQLVRELEADADSYASDELEAAHREIVKLTELNKKLRTERDEAQKQLRKIAAAQRTIADMLGNSVVPG